MLAKRPLGRPKRIWEKNIEVDLKDTGHKYVVCFQLAKNIGPNGNFV
jgi:hypothetical protein